MAKLHVMAKRKRDDLAAATLAVSTKALNPNRQTPVLKTPGDLPEHKDQAGMSVEKSKRKKKREESNQMDGGAAGAAGGQQQHAVEYSQQHPASVDEVAIDQGKRTKKKKKKQKSNNDDNQMKQSGALHIQRTESDQPAHQPEPGIAQLHATQQSGLRTALHRPVIGVKTQCVSTEHTNGKEVTKRNKKKKDQTQQHTANTHLQDDLLIQPDIQQSNAKVDGHERHKDSVSQHVSLDSAQPVRTKKKRKFGRVSPQPDVDGRQLAVLSIADVSDLKSHQAVERASDQAQEENQHDDGTATGHLVAEQRQTTNTDFQTGIDDANVKSEARNEKKKKSKKRKVVNIHEEDHQVVTAPDTAVHVQSASNALKQPAPGAAAAVSVIVKQQQPAACHEQTAADKDGTTQVGHDKQQQQEHIHLESAAGDAATNIKAKKKKKRDRLAESVEPGTQQHVEAAAAVTALVSHKASMPSTEAAAAVATTNSIIVQPRDTSPTSIGGTSIAVAPAAPIAESLLGPGPEEKKPHKKKKRKSEVLQDVLKSQALDAPGQHGSTGPALVTQEGDCAAAAVKSHVAQPAADHQHHQHTFSAIEQSTAVHAKEGRQRRKKANKDKDQSKTGSLQAEQVGSRLELPETDKQQEQVQQQEQQEHAVAVAVQDEAADVDDDIIPASIAKSKRGKRAIIDSDSDDDDENDDAPIIRRIMTPLKTRAAQQSPPHPATVVNQVQQECNGARHVQQDSTQDKKFESGSTGSPPRSTSSEPSHRQVSNTSSSSRSRSSSKDTSSSSPRESSPSSDSRSARSTPSTSTTSGSSRETEDSGSGHGSGSQQHNGMDGSDANGSKDATKSNTTSSSSSGSEGADAGGEEEPANKSAGKAGHNIWKARCQRFLTTCLSSDCYEIIAKSVVTWKPHEIWELLGDLSPNTFAAVFAEFSESKLAALLEKRPAAYVSTVCESFPEDQLVKLIPCFKLEVAKQVLNSLYFSSSDPYLTILDVKHILMAFNQGRRDQLCRRLDRNKVKKVLDADSDAEGEELDHDEQRSDKGSDSFESSFVVSDDAPEDEERDGDDAASSWQDLEDSDA